MCFSPKLLCSKYASQQNNFSVPSVRFFRLQCNFIRYPSLQNWPVSEKENLIILNGLQISVGVQRFPYTKVTHIHSVWFKISNQPGDDVEFCTQRALKNCESSAYLNQSHRITLCSLIFNSAYIAYSVSLSGGYMQTNLFIQQTSLPVF